MAASKTWDFPFLPSPHADHTKSDPRGREQSLPSLPGQSLPLPVSVMLTPPSPTCSPRTALIHWELKALYDVLVLTWPTDHSELKFTAGVGELDIWALTEVWALLGWSQRESCKGSMSVLFTAVNPLTSPDSGS